MISYRSSGTASADMGANHFALIPFIDMIDHTRVFCWRTGGKWNTCRTPRTFPSRSRCPTGKPSAAVVGHDHQDSVYVDGQLVGSVKDVAANEGPIFAPLKAHWWRRTAAACARRRQTDIRQAGVTIMGDKSTPYSVLKRSSDVQRSRYGKVSFAVRRARKGGRDLNGRREPGTECRHGPAAVLPAL